MLTVETSVQSLLAHKQQVIRSFYDRFLEAVPEASRFFGTVDLDRQATMLTMALMVVETHGCEDFPAVQHYLRVLGHRHHILGIPEDMYAYFRECLISSIRDFHGEEWTEQLASDWHSAMDRTKTTMLEGYEKSYVY